MRRAQGLPNEQRSGLTEAYRRHRQTTQPLLSGNAGARLPHWRSSVPSQRFAVEFDRRTVGIAVRVPGGFMFFSSVDRFDVLDGRVFPRARAIERQLKKVARTTSRGFRATAQLPAV